MADIEYRLRAAMHAAVDGEEASPDALIGQVMRRHRRHSAMVAATSALVVLAVAISAVIAVRAALRPSRPQPTHHVTPLPRPTHHVKRTAKRLPAAMSGLPMPAGTDFQLLIPTRHKAGWYSTRTHRIVPTGGGLSGYGIEFRRVEGGWSESEAVGGGPIWPLAQHYFIADGSRLATPIGAGVAGQGGVAPASHAGAVWLVSYSHNPGNLDAASATAQLVSTAGAPLGPRHRLPAGYWLDRGVGSDLLLDRLYPSGKHNGPYLSVLWDPRTRRVVRRFDNVIAAGPQEVAWGWGCRTCRLQIFNLSTGTTVATVVPGGRGLDGGGMMTDDGRWLAVELRHADRLAVVSTSTGAATLIPGTNIRFSQGMSFGWYDASHLLLIATNPGSVPYGPTQIAYWQPGDTRLRVATVRRPSEINVIENGFALAQW